MSSQNFKFSLFQLFPSFKGKLRISRLFYSRKRRKHRQSIRVKYGLKFKLPSLIDSIGYELFVNGIYEPKTIRYLVDSLPRNAVFVDVGANIGAISVFVAKLRPDVKVFAIEASPFVYSHLKENVELNGLNNISVFNFAVHNQDNLVVKIYAPQGQFGKGSFSKTFTSESEDVKTIQLDSFFRANNITPASVKVDVQGYELFVFQGLAPYLMRVELKPEIIFEFEDWSERIAMGEENITIAQKYLRDLGYRIYDFSKQGITPLDSVVSVGSCELLAK